VPSVSLIEALARRLRSTRAVGKAQGLSQKVDPVTGCTCARLRRLTRRMTALYDRELAPTGLKLTQYSLLATLRREGGDAGRPGVRSGGSHGHGPHDADPQPAPLLDQGLVELGADGGRQSASGPDHAKGNAAFVHAMPYWRVAQDFVNRTLGEADVGACMTGWIA
jgi:hypothetical protein